MAYKPKVLVVAEGGTADITLTNHGVLIGQGTSAVAATAAGSSGQVLQSGGASADPVYSTATYPATASTSGNILTSDGTNIVSTAPVTAGAAWVKIQGQTPSGSSGITFTSGITATYNTYILSYENVTVAGALNLVIQISTNAGVSYISTNYQSGINNAPYNSSTLTNTNTATGFWITAFSANTVSANGIIYLRNMTSGSGIVACHAFNEKYNSAGTASMEINAGAYTTAATTVNALQVVPSASTFSGTFTLYGMRQ